MNRKNATRNAFFTSVLSLLLCVSMLVGTTFAWFTDEVVSGMNTIAAGNLDVELLAKDGEVKPDTELFKLVDAQGKDTWWEPGMVVYENLQVANVGTLALKYQMTLNFGNENDLNGHKLSEVLKVAVLEGEEIAQGATRAEVLALAQAEVADDQGNGTLSNFYVTGDLEANEANDKMAVVIYWEPNANEIDNLYNANNGQVTSDEKPLHIEFGVNLQATQKMSENDSFDNKYDESAAILPKATVNNTGAQTVPVFMGYSEDEIALDTSFQFLPNESEDAAAVSEYKDWHADYVITADKDVPADSVALAGYYKAWCGDNGWVVLTGPEVKAGDEIRLVNDARGVTVSYEEICQYGNDGIGFLCGATDLTGANAGTTITVELRMYETDETLGALSTTDSETGNYEVIGTYSYTFGGNWVYMEDGTVLFKGNQGEIQLYDTQNVEAVDYAVPAGVTHLGNYSLSYNTSIENVTLPNSVVDLGRAFDSNSTVKKVVLNKGLTSISSRAFRSTGALEEVVISSTVETIEDNAFQKSAIKEIVIPGNVETIGETAFGASKIEKVTIEGNTSIQGYAFRGCANLSKVYLNGDDVTFIASTLNGRNSTWFCNGESNNPNTSNITFYVKNETVAARVKTAMGAEAANTPVYVNGVLYEG